MPEIFTWSKLKEFGLWLELKSAPNAEKSCAFQAVVFDSDGVQASANGQTPEHATCEAINWWQVNRAVYDRKHAVIK